MSEIPRERLAKAIADARADESPDERGKVMKVIFTDEQGERIGEWASSQLPEDPFAGLGAQYSGLREPPYSLPQLAYLAETHPVHSAALEQKTVDICSKGWEWKAKDEDNADEEKRDELEDWFSGLGPEDMSMREVLDSAWLDKETVGWGLLELVRDPQGVMKRVYQVPGHTVRAHKDGVRLCQIREERKVWFRRWGVPDDKGKRIEVDMHTGSLTKIKEPANDLFVVRQPSRRSTWYGIPGYISAIGWITLALAARDDNLMFFANRREPRWAIILTNLTENPTIEEDIRRAFTVDLRQPYRNIILPIQGPGDVTFNKLGESKQEGSFDRLSERADKAIMIAHRVPAERLANASVGPLGGTSTVEASRIYKEAVVGPGQELLQTRLNRLIDVEWPISVAGGKRPAAERAEKFRKVRKEKPKEPNPDEAQWKLVMADLDIASDREDLDQTVLAFHANLITLREARHKLKMKPLMRKIFPEEPEEPVEQPPDEPVLDPVTQQPLKDEVTGKPLMKPGTPTPPPPKELPSPEGITEEEESPYNDMLFTQLPGSATAAGPPGKIPSGTGGLAPPVSGQRLIRSIRGEPSEGDAVLPAVRELLISAKETRDLLVDASRTREDASV